ncbi:MAG: RNA-binding protein [Brevundimonas sp.]|uniref:RNA-binding protein n=1 Tax=Brevundimonas sp. TaxID=1871086 RepID=UPI002735423A|nr:RNA-binding protein [Brevundimonas sp.]MDP3657671.1 RNA-binding protein [Brevundimonas sp.]MDZ4108790.1 RNA-binding protein [Brevundimonas sp.]
MSDVEVFLDDTPGEVRGVIARDGHFHHLLIQREDEITAHRLGARSVGRIVDVQPGLKGAFVDLGVGPPFGFLPTRKGDGVAVGRNMEVEVVAEPRERKGPTLRLIGAAEGAPGLRSPGPTVAETLARLAPGVEPVTGPAAIQASWNAEEAALSSGELFHDTGLDIAVERTRALIAVDLDLAPRPGMAATGPARDRTNRQGLHQAARMIRLKRWGGLTAIDLIGVGHDGEAVLRTARQAFGADPDIVYGPVNRFGVLQLALPWRETPLEELLNDAAGRRRPEHRAQDLVRSLRHSLLSDTTTARIIVRCAPEEAALAGPLVARLGPRAHLVGDSAIASGAFAWEEG